MSSSRQQQSPQQASSRPRPEWDVLLSAAQKNDATRIRALVNDHGISPSHANGVGQSALHVAALWGHVEACRALLDLGANVHAANALSGATPLHMVVQPPHKASLAQQEQVVDLLLAAGADPTLPDHFGKLPVDYVVEQWQTAKSATPQAASLSSSSSSLVQKLQIAAPPLWTYIQQGQVANVQMELPTHPEACRKVVRNQSAGTIALEAFLQQCQELLSEQPQQQQDDAATSTTVTLQDRFQILQLVVAALGGGGEKGGLGRIIKPDSHQPQALQQMEEEWKDPPLFRVLDLLRDAYKQQQQQPGPSLLQPSEPSRLQDTIAVLEQAAILLQSLEQPQSSFQEEDDHDENNDQTAPTPNHHDNEWMERQARWLHMAARRNEVTLLQFLCTGLQWNVNLVNRQGMTALQFAARSGQVAALQFLLQQPGIDLHHVDHQGQSALQAAIVNQRTELVALLEEAATLPPPPPLHSSS
ncbi:hypothetical protein ACA910_021813 [Epithemia clementina (nom. ined.)]